MRRSNRWIAGLILAAAIAAPWTVFGQESPASPGGGEKLSATGTVVSIGDEIVIQMSDGREMAFVVDDVDLLPANLDVGAHVTIGYRQSSDGSLRLSDVAVMPGGDAAGTARSAGSTAMPAAGSRTMSATESEGTPATESHTMSASGSSMSGEDLPDTASPLALYGLIGLCALGAGMGLRLRRS
jgi:hypothetical protein